LLNVLEKYLAMHQPGLIFFTEIYQLVSQQASWYHRVLLHRPVSHHSGLIKLSHFPHNMTTGSKFENNIMTWHMMELLFYCATSILQDKINYNGVN
jgi:hypothetical protein